MFSGFQFDTEDEDKVLPDFLNSIAGIKRGETKTFPYTFPDTWKQENLHGLRALFTVSSFIMCANACVYLFMLVPITFTKISFFLFCFL